MTECTKSPTSVFFLGLIVTSSSWNPSFSRPFMRWSSSSSPSSPLKPDISQTFIVWDSLTVIFIRFLVTMDFADTEGRNSKQVWERDVIREFRQEDLPQPGAPRRRMLRDFTPKYLNSSGILQDWIWALFFWTNCFRRVLSYSSFEKAWVLIVLTSQDSLHFDTLNLLVFTLVLKQYSVLGINLAM